jgi:hypothetical protein
MKPHALSHFGTLTSDTQPASFMPQILANRPAPGLVPPPTTPQILNAVWAPDASGAWTNGANWSTQVIVYVDGNPEIQNEPIEPEGAYNVSLAPGGTTPFTVTYATTDSINSLASNQYATLDVTSGTLTLAANAGFGGAVIEQAGLIDAQDGWQISGGFTQSAGATIEIDAGNLAVSSGTLSGTVTGAGNLYFAGGDTFTLGAGFVTTTGTVEVGVNGDGFGSVVNLAENLTYTGLFLIDDYSGNNAQLNLGGHTLSLHGTSYLDGNVAGPGTLAAYGITNGSSSAYDELNILAGATYAEHGTLTQELNTALNGTIDVVAGGVWDIAANGNITPSGATGKLINAGTFEKTAGTGTSSVAANVTNTGTFAATTGTLEVQGKFANTGLISGSSVTVDAAFSGLGTIDVGTLTLKGGGSLGGTLTGTGLIDVTNGATTTLTAETALTLGTLEVSGGATFVLASAESTSADFVLAGAVVELGKNDLTITGSASLTGTMTGSGTLTTSNASIDAFLALTGTEKWVDSGTITQNSNAQLGGAITDKVTLSVGKGDTYNITGAYGIGNANINDTGTATITNAGLFEMTATSGQAVIYNTDFTSTGTLLVGGVLNLQGGKTVLGGSVSGSGDLALNTAWTLDANTSLTAADIANNGSGTLAGGAAYAGSFTQYGGGTIALEGHSLSLIGGSTLSGEIGGAGVLTLKNAVVNGFSIYGTSTLIDSGLISQQGSTTIGNSSTDSSTLTIDKGATWTVTGNNQWLGNPNQGDTGVATITNAGLFTTAAGNSVDVWHSNFTNTGTLLADGSIRLNGNTGTLGGTLAGTGYLDLGLDWTLESTAKVTVAQLDNEGAGTLTANFSYGGTYTNGNGATLTLAGHTLDLTGPTSLGGSMGSAGTLSVTDATANNFYLFGTTTLVDAGTISQTGLVWLGSGSTDTGTLDVSAGATWSVTGNQDIGNVNQNDTGVGAINNAGLVTAGAGDALAIYHSIFTNTGTLQANGSLYLEGNSATLGGSLVGAGYLQLATSWTLGSTAVVSVAQLDNEGSGTLSANLTYAGTYTNGYGATLSLGASELTLTGPAAIGGTISGAGTLLLDGGADSFTGNATITAADLRLSSGTQLTLDQNLTYGGIFYVASGLNEGIALNGNTLSITGAATLGNYVDSLAVSGPGILSLSGAATEGGVTIGTGATLLAAGTETQIGSLTLGTTAGAGTLAVSATGTWDISSARTITSGGAGGTITNAGLFERAGASGEALVTAAFTNTGTVEVTTGTLVFTGGFSNTGTIIGHETSANGTVTITALTPADFGLSPATHSTAPAGIAAVHQAPAAPPDWAHAELAPGLLTGHGHN